MARKTISVDALREHVNTMLRISAPEASCEREGMAGVLESVLHLTDNYRGFAYLEVKMDGKGKVITLGDETRRFYH